MQVLAYGTPDMYLMGNPEISYFKAVYRRHTNFAMESIQNTFDTAPKFGERVTATISRNGDLMSKVYIQALLPDITEKGLPDFGITPDGFNLPNRRYTRWVDNVGHYLIKWVEIEIGGQVIDRHYSDWLEIWAQLTVPTGKMDGYRAMIGQDSYNVFGQNTGLQADVLRVAHPTYAPANFPQYQGTPDNILVGREIYIPLQFWFCRDYGMALPLIALQHHEVKINIEFRDVPELLITYNGDVASETPNWDFNDLVIHDNIDVSLWIDYVFLDGDERRKFAQVSHEYLIEQTALQRERVYSGSDDRPYYNKIEMHFEHPVKELIWVCKGFEHNKEWCNFTNTQMRSRPPLDTVRINAGVPQAGLAGLPSGKLTQDQIETITFYYTNNILITAGTELTVVNDEGDADNTHLVFNGNGIYFNVGDLVVASTLDESRQIELLVSAVTDGVPTQFSLVANVGLPSVEYESVSVVDQLGTTAVVAGGDIDSLEGGTLAGIRSLSELLDFASYNSTRPYNYLGPAGNPVKMAGIQLNGYDLTGVRQSGYFNWYQPKRHHQNIPASPGLNVYSFAYKPEDQQPSGSCNFSRLDTARLQLWLGSLYSEGTTLDPGQIMEVSVYSRNYNILRVMSGMAGLAYA